MSILEKECVSIRLEGLDPESYMELIKTVLFLIGNQRKESPLTPDEIGQLTHLVSEMLPGSENLITTPNKTL